MFPQYEHRVQSIYAMQHNHQGNYPARFHKHVEIMILLNTSLKITIHGVSYTLLPGDLYIAFPNILHSVEAKDAQALVLLVDYEEYQAFHDLLLYHHPQTPVLRKGEYPESILFTMQRMIDLAQADDPYRKQTLAGYANAVLGELMNCLTLLPRNMDGPLMQKLQFYILENYTRNISLESVARELGYSKYYISRIISDLFGCNFRTLINAYRIALAQNLLVSSTDSISQIARNCGYKSQSAFNRTFIQQTGLTPRQYRQQTEQIPEKPALYQK